MQINTIEWHEGAQQYYGIASSVRGRRYRFGVYANGRVAWADREVLGAPVGTWWWHLRTPPVALRRCLCAAARREYRKFAKAA